MDEQQTFDWTKRADRLRSVDEIFETASEELLTRLAEDHRIEHKPGSYTGSNLAEYVCMWANTRDDGGLIVIGQKDKKNGGGFEGCKSLSPEAVNKIRKVAQTYCPDAKPRFKHVEVTNVKGQPDFVILIRVPYVPDMVVRTTSGKVFIRVADSKTELKTPEEIRELQGEKGEISFEQRPSSLTYPDDFDLKAVRAFVRAVRTQRKLDSTLSDVEILEVRRLGKRSGGEFIPNHACVLLFAKNPVSVLPGCIVRCQRFDGREERTGEEYNSVKDDRLEGTVSSLIVQTEAWLESQLRVFSPQDLATGKFFPIPEYPKLAWYEAIVNACGHRSYGNGLKNMTIFVKLFDDRLVVESPGPFPPFVTPENIYEMHVPRNPVLMDALFYLDHDVKCAHEGTRRIRDQMKQSDLPVPEFRTAQETLGHLVVRVTLRNDIDMRRKWVDRDVTKIISQAVAVSLSDKDRELLNWIAANNSTTISDASRLVEVSWKSARMHLQSLTRKNIVQYIRFQPFGHNKRDPKAFFRLRSDAPLPPGAFDASVEFSSA